MSPQPPRVLALLGDPVEHSLSPVLHEAAFRALDLDARYVALRTLSGELPHLIRAFARAGGGNVTVPHKTAAREAVDRQTEAVRATGACNCFWADGEGRVAGDNTDVGGFLQAVEAWSAAPPLAGARVLLVGAGGAARAVAAACQQAGVERLDVRNRTRKRARQLAGQLDGGTMEIRVLEAANPLDPEVRYHLAVNATSLGLNDRDPLPLELDGAPVGAAFDLVYGPGGTAWTRRAAEVGIPASDGREMLIRQAGLSLRRWFGVDPPLPAMRRAAERAMDR